MHDPEQEPRPETDAAGHRYLSREQSRAVDRYAIDELGFPGTVLMENAGRGCVDQLEAIGVDGPVLVMTGTGNNAGDGFVIARHLAIRGHQVKVALGGAPHRLKGDARTAFEMLLPCHVTILDLTGVHAGEMITELDSMVAMMGEEGPRWIVDALLGTGAKGAPRPPFDALIDWINAETANKLAIDLPSGLDADTGEPSPTTIRADHTCTFVAPKLGFRKPAAAEFLGEVHVVNIGVPEHVIEHVIKADHQA